MTRRAPQAKAAPWTSAQIVAYLRREARDWHALSEQMANGEMSRAACARDVLREAARVIASHTRKD